jgi:hypothetical protein
MGQMDEGRAEAGIPSGRTVGKTAGRVGRVGRAGRVGRVGKDGYRARLVRSEGRAVSGVRRS